LGGDQKHAFRYVKQNGLSLDEDYPYMNQLRSCSYDADTMRAVGISDYKVFLQIRNEDMKHLLC